MKRRIYSVPVLAVGLALLAGCRSLEEIEKEEANARLAEENARAAMFAKTKQAADAGNGNMAYQAGIMLTKGYGVKQDPKQAFVYFEKAVQAGDLSAALYMYDQICKTQDITNSKLFGDCFEIIWTTLWTPYIWDIKAKQRYFSDYGTYEESLREGLRNCITYLRLLVKMEKDEEAYKLKKRVMSIPQKKPKEARKDAIEGGIVDKSFAIKTKTSISL